METTEYNTGPGSSQGMGYERSNKQDIGRGRGNSAFDQIKSTVADKLHAAAQTIHQKTAGSARPSEFSDFGHRAADWLERSADYVSDLEPQRLKTDLENQVRRNPGRSLLIAGAVGLVLGRVIRRR